MEHDYIKLDVNKINDSTTLNVIVILAIECQVTNQVVCIFAETRTLSVNKFPKLQVTTATIQLTEQACSRGIG